MLTLNGHRAQWVCKAAGAAVAIDERVNPGHALMGGSSDDELVFEQMRAGIDLIEAREE
jgi:hypothetical protein